MLTEHGEIVLRLLCSSIPPVVGPLVDLKLRYWFSNQTNAFVDDDGIAAVGNGCLAILNTVTGVGPRTERIL
ncbi:unnamed protein product [Haemonchus placei]|uniref:AraC family transcriptional regulator n=1 Tax=Haemonchus placei TaxID=6290 RepID=A0A0N4WBZ5_HAEPC|nr:unnamed protein product [Haemonchus placei]